MHYVLLIHNDPAAYSQLTPDEMAQLGQQVGEFDASISEGGHNLGSIRLQPAHMAKSITVRAGRPLTTDGPFSESKEQLGGIYIIQAKDDAEAEKIAAKLPVARYGTVELRPALGVDLRGEAFQMYDGLMG